MSRIKREFKQQKFMLRIVKKGCDSNFRYAVTYHQATWGKKDRLLHIWPVNGTSFRVMSFEW